MKKEEKEEVEYLAGGFDGNSKCYSNYSGNILGLGKRNWLKQSRTWRERKSTLKLPECLGVKICPAPDTLIRLRKYLLFLCTSIFHAKS
ncbi:hypothetical protein R3I94_003351 [Phoxinus phoxinus]